MLTVTTTISQKNMLVTWKPPKKDCFFNRLGCVFAALHLPVDFPSFPGPPGRRGRHGDPRAAHHLELRGTTTFLAAKGSKDLSMKNLQLWPQLWSFSRCRWDYTFYT